MNTSGVTLRLLDKADKEILKLPRTVKGAFFDFQHKFRSNPYTTGLKLQQLKGDSRLWSARVNDEYRALLLRLADDDWLIVSVKHRKDVYNRLSYGVNQVTGGIEYVDLEVVEDSVLRRLSAPPAPTPASTEPFTPAQTARCSPGLVRAGRTSGAARTAPAPVRRLVRRAAGGPRCRRTPAARHPHPRHRGPVARPRRVRAAAHR
jgi:mRNA-degrading endonuclease RelE of RelBE toxin-antitoxin system